MTLANHLIPFDTGLDANDDIVGPCVILHPEFFDYAHGSHPQLRPHPIPVFVSFEVDSGSGSNTWALEPVRIINHRSPRDNWDVVPFPVGQYGHIIEPALDSADLPVTDYYEWPSGMTIGIRMTRSGAGTNTLRVRVTRISD